MIYIIGEIFSEWHTMHVRIDLFYSIIFPYIHRPLVSVVHRSVINICRRRGKGSKQSGSEDTSQNGDFFQSIEKRVSAKVGKPNV